MYPALSFTGGLIGGLIFGVVASIALFFVAGAFANAMGARTRGHRRRGWETAIRVLQQLKPHIDPQDQYEVDLAVGLMKNDIKHNLY